jgi:hypothetical protein
MKTAWYAFLVPSDPCGGSGGRRIVDVFEFSRESEESKLQTWTEYWKSAYHLIADVFEFSREASEESKRQKWTE